MRLAPKIEKRYSNRAWRAKQAQAATAEDGPIKTALFMLWQRNENQLNEVRGKFAGHYEPTFARWVRESLANFSRSR